MSLIVFVILSANKKQYHHIKENSSIFFFLVLCYRNIFYQHILHIKKFPAKDQRIFYPKQLVKLTKKRSYIVMITLYDLRSYQLLNSAQMLVLVFSGFLCLW